jgi:hypothetical protein
MLAGFSSLPAGVGVRFGSLFPEDERDGRRRPVHTCELCSRRFESESAVAQPVFKHFQGTPTLSPACAGMARKVVVRVRSPHLQQPFDVVYLPLDVVYF